MARVVVELEIPEGATHYQGNLLYEPTYLKRTVAIPDKWTMWRYWCSRRSNWFLEVQGPEYTMPNWTEEIPFCQETK